MRVNTFTLKSSAGRYAQDQVVSFTPKLGFVPVYVREEDLQVFKPRNQQNRD